MVNNIIIMISKTDQFEPGNKRVTYMCDTISEIFNSRKIFSVVYYFTRGDSILVPYFYFENLSTLFNEVRALPYTTAAIAQY